MSDPATPYEKLSAQLLLHPAVERSTMMGYPCLRFEGRFFACQDPRNKHLILKLPKERVIALVEAGSGLPFAPSGRVFREWVELDNSDEAGWAALLEEARAFAAKV